MKWFWRVVDRCVSPATVEVPLADLARLWLPCNRTFEPVVKEAPSPAGEMPTLTAQDHAGPSEVEASVPRREETPPVTQASISHDSVQPVSPMIEQFLVPYERTLRRQHVWEPLQRIVALLEELGQCPSVVMVHTEHDRESGQELYTLRETLARVTLRDHTELVTHLVLQEVCNRYPDPDVLMPKMLVVALGHDLGKIPTFRGSGLYSKKDHPEISVVKVRELFQGVEVAWLDDACELIRTHHQWTKSELGGLFKRMDGKARELEVARVTKTLSVKRWEEWFSVEQLLAIIAPSVNRVSRGGKWEAFDFGDSVFCVPELVLKATRELAKVAQVIDIHVTRDTDQELVLRRVIGELRTAECLSHPVGDGYYGRKFAVQTPATRRKSGVRHWYLVPLKREAFGAGETKFQKVQHSLLEGVRHVELVV